MGFRVGEYDGSIEGNSWLDCGILDIQDASLRREISRNCDENVSLIHDFVGILRPVLMLLNALNQRDKSVIAHLADSTSRSPVKHRNGKSPFFVDSRVLRRIQSPHFWGNSHS